METSIEYQSYIADTKNLKTTQGRLDYQAPYTNDFEAIFSRVMDEDIKLSTAKNFIENLSPGELGIIQKYNGLADAIDKGSLNAEAAYNLLMHDNEQYDFNKDGTTQVGAANIMSTVPAAMTPDIRGAYIEALNSLEGKDRLMAITLTFDTARITFLINNTPYTPQTIDYAYLSEKVDQMLNPTGGGFTSEETKEGIKAFWEVLENSYNGKKNVNVEEKREPTVEKFLNDLRTKGAVVFLADFNKEKIEDMIKEFKEKLVKSMGSTPENLVEIEQLVNAYRKQLLEEMEANLDDDEKNIKINTQATVKILLDLKDKEEKPLEKLLQIDS